MENKLYYQNAYIKSFTSRVVDQNTDELGNHYVTLEQTAFYPTGGGQPHDLGTINQVKVINVEEIDGKIRHYLERPIELVGEVYGEIDWDRRFDHMQQHAGQHILSAAFDSLFEYKTIGFHLGKETLTIDLDTEHLSEEEVREAETLANQIILENRPIETKWVTDEEISKYSLRKQLSVTENIRLVIIPDFDYNGCGGTHPKDTAQVKAIKILDWERQKKKIRVEFVCGNRVLEQLHVKQKVLLELTQLLNAPEKEMKTAVQRLIDSGKELAKNLEVLKDSLLHFEAEKLLKENNTRDEEIIHVLYTDRSIQELQKLARIMVASNDQITFIAVSENENRIQVVGARGKKVSRNMKNIVGDILPLINGRGGGNESFAQAGGELLVSGEKLLDQLVQLARRKNE